MQQIDTVTTLLEAGADLTIRNRCALVWLGLHWADGMLPLLLRALVWGRLGFIFWDLIVPCTPGSNQAVARDLISKRHRDLNAIFDKYQNAWGASWPCSGTRVSSGHCLVVCLIWMCCPATLDLELWLGLAIYCPGVTRNRDRDYGNYCIFLKHVLDVIPNYLNYKKTDHIITRN